MPSDHSTLVSEYINAVGDGRLDELPTYLTPDVSFQAPGLPSHHGLDAYTSSLKRLAPIIARNEIKRIFTEDNEACVIYDFVTNTPAGAVASIEWLTIKDGQIASVYLLFDKAHWPEVLQALQEKTTNP